MRHIRIEPVCIRDGNIVECCTSIAGEFDRIIGVGKSIETELQTAVMVGVLYFKYDTNIIFSGRDSFMGWFIPIESSYIPLKRHSLHFDQAEFAGGSGNLVAVLSKNGCAATYGGTAQPRNR